MKHLYDNEYVKMWENFAGKKGEAYLGYKFLPNHRVGLTNFIREWVILRVLNPTKKSVIADIGCASGRQLFLLANHISSGFGTDIASGFIEVANQHKFDIGNKNLTFLEAKIEQLPFADGKFDAVICGEVLEHVYDKNVALDELMRITKINGSIIISTPNINADGTWWGRILRAVGVRRFQSLEHFSSEELVKHGDAHVREFTGVSMRAWLLSRGLAVEQLYYASYLDGPACDYVLKFPLHMWGLRHGIIWLEKILSLTRLPFGRHIIVKAKKLPT